MLFFSFEFILLFLTVIILYYFISKKWRWLLLLIASYIFYGYHNPIYIILLLSSTLVDFVAGQRIDASEGTRRRYWLLLSICINLGLLFFFKYFNFFGDQMVALVSLFGIDMEAPKHSLALPIGLSFYTFQTISYVVDIYRGYLKPERHFGRFALYVCFFPQLLAGPIEKARDLIPQFHFNHRFDYDLAVSGLRLILWGLFKKLVIADRIAKYVNEVFAVGSGYQGSVIVIAAFLFWLQLLYDFGAYCNIAIGSARLLGVKLSLNFYNHIYLRSFTEFWKEWHVTLTNWFRNYVFFAIVQIRKSRVFWYCSLLVTFALTGLWHGAKWTFILWGALNGLLLIFEHLTTKPRDRLFSMLGADRFPRIRFALGMVVFLGVSLVLSLTFRAENLAHLWDLLGGMSTWNGWQWQIEGKALEQIGMFCFLGCSELLNIRMGKKPFDEYCSLLPVFTRWLIYLFFIYTLLLLQVNTNDFIYFDF